MKYKLITITLLFFVIIANAQDKQELEVKNLFWGSNDKYKNATKIPDKWKNESAVIIYKNINYSYHKFSTKVTYKTSYRKRIKLLDKNAVKEFSKFSFKKRFRSRRGKYSHKKKGKVFFGIKIIKEDGKEIEIDLDKEAIKEKDDYKVAISNLEVNDIIDFYYYTLEPFKTKYEYTFEAQERTLSEVYPIMNFKLYLESENDFFINFKSLNGAPELKKIPSEKRNFRKYELLASDIPKSDFPIWFYPLLEVPSIKFQVYFARTGKLENRTIAFLGENEKEIKSNVTKEDVLKLYDHQFRPFGRLGDIIKYFRTKNFNSDEEKVTAAYYYMRHYYLTRFVEAFVANDAKIINLNTFTAYGDPVFIKNKRQFIDHFIAFLKDYKIGYEIVVGTKRFNGNIKDLLLEENVEVLVKIKTKKPMYAQFFGPHTNINQIKPLLQDTDVYLLTSNKRHKIEAAKEGHLPSSNYKENVSFKEINLVLNEEFSGFSVKTYNSFKGYSKIGKQSDRLLFYDYVYEDYAKYETKKLLDFIRRKKNKIKIEKEFDAVISKLKDNQKKRFEKQVKSEFSITDIKNYKHTLINTGRYGLDTNFEYDESFTFKNQFIKKAGSNYIVEIGKFIGGQIEIVDEKRQRNAGIYMPYPRTFNYHIKLKIPEGYTVSGLDKLTKNVTNSTGAFISTVKLEGGILNITTSKQYKHNYEPKENWSQILQFLDEANQFKNEKILLKKIK